MNGSISTISHRYRIFSRVVMEILAGWQAVFLYVAIVWHDVMTSHLIKFDASYEDWLLKQQKIYPSWGQREDLCIIFFCVGMALMFFILALEREEYQRWLRLKFSVVCGLASALVYLEILFYVEHFVSYCPLYMTLLLPEIFSLMHLWILFHIKHQIDSEVGI